MRERAHVHEDGHNVTGLCHPDRIRATHGQARQNNEERPLGIGPEEGESKKAEGLPSRERLVQNIDSQGRSMRGINGRGTPPLIPFQRPKLTRLAWKDALVTLQLPPGLRKCFDTSFHLPFAGVRSCGGRRSPRHAHTRAHTPTTGKATGKERKGTEKKGKGRKGVTR